MAPRPGFSSSVFATFGLAASCLLIACPPKAPTPPDGGPAETLGADAGAPDAGVELPIFLQRPDGDGGTAELRWDPSEPQILEATSQLEVAIGAGLANYRVRVLDEADRAMVSDDEVREVEGRTLYRIAFREPLRPGHRYTLVVDAQTGSSIADNDGRLYPDQRLELKIAGEKVKEQPPPKPKRRRRR